MAPIKNAKIIIPQTAPTIAISSIVFPPQLSFKIIVFFAKPFHHSVCFLMNIDSISYHNTKVNYRFFFVIFPLFLRLSSFYFHKKLSHVRDSVSVCYVLFHITLYLTFLYFSTYNIQISYTGTHYEKQLPESLYFIDHSLSTCRMPQRRRAGDDFCRSDHPWIHD